MRKLKVLFCTRPISCITNKSREKKNSQIRIFIIKQLKRQEEYHFLKKLYGRSFILIGAYADQDKRFRTLVEYSKNDDIRNKVNALIETDLHEKQNSPYGQGLSDLFPQAHCIINCSSEHRNDTVRFVELLFSYNFHTPSNDEICMYMARNVSLRSSDLSRQVGAVIADDHGNIISVRFNEVPKPGGGYYDGNGTDNRDFILGHDPNTKRKQSRQNELAEKLHEILSGNSTKFINEDDHQIRDEIEKIINEQLGDYIAESRTVHAEEAAICDAAKRGVSVYGKTLYATTFPCHLCAKHILAVGIKRVVFIR